MNHFIVNLFRENKQAIFFLAVFLILYLMLNSAYGIYVNTFLPEPDPITIFVSKHVVWLLSWWDESVEYVLREGYKNVIIKNRTRSVIEVFEGCNGINVMIVFGSFMAAFRGKLKATVFFTLAGIAIIYVMNLLRVSLLYGVEMYWPRYLYLVHKYLFTGIIYFVVFILWFVWARNVKYATVK